jgi:hypothetical protein
MKVLILPDDRYNEVLRVLGPAAPGHGLPDLDAEKLHRLARNSGVPEQFQVARERAEAAEAARVQMRDAMHDLILAADRLGIGPSKLAEWSGYTTRRIHQLTRGAQ